VADVASRFGRRVLGPRRGDRARVVLAHTNERLAVVLSTVVVLLLGAFCFYAFVLPQTPARLERASVALFDDFALWSWLDGLPLPVPRGEWGVAAALIVSSLAAFALYGLALYATWGRRAGRRVLALVLGAAVVFALVSVLALPNINTDIYNYIVTGRVAAVHEANPYEVAPDRFPSDPVYPYAGHRFTAHPDVKLPAWMLLSVPLAWVAGDDPVTNLLVYRFAFFAFSVACLFLLVAIMSRLDSRYALTAAVAWGWNPIVALLATSKVDTVMVFFLLLAILFLVASRARSAAVSLMLSALVKLITLPFAATYWLGEVAKRRWRRLVTATALMAATVVAVYLPFTRSTDLPLEHLGLIERRGSGDPVDGEPSAEGPARLLLAIGYGFLILWVGLTQADTTRRLLRGWAVLAIYFALFLAPLGLSWYLLVPIAIAGLAIDWRLLLVTGLVSFSSFLVYTWDSMSTEEFPLPDIFAISRGTVYLGAVAVGVLGVLALLVRRSNRRAVTSA
jgi:Glycosyltransferase family 87